ncbi:MAG: hypothetical protein KDA57_10150 [Planctomycetales bacterium]|nr:hypothetical protein [Planctomycetales bacterium]
MRSLSVLPFVLGLLVSTLFSIGHGRSAWAVGVLYNDPGWYYSYDGNEAFYNDLDGPNPDYINGTDANSPGGQSGTPALVDPRVLDPGCNPSQAGNCADAEWTFKSSQWDGTAPGDPLGGVPTGTPPIIPAAPGGVATYTDSGTTYLRVQDPGQPQSYGWVDKNAQAGPGAPRQEGNNRKIQFAHDLTVDPLFNGNHAILDNGVTISFRARLATAATGPIDDIFVEGGTTLGDTLPWPTDGFGSRVYNDGRGMFHLTQTGAGGEQQMAFSLMGQSTIDSEGLTVTKTGLVMNNNALDGADVDTNFATDANMNVVEIPSADLDEWHEFWITIQALAVPVNGNTHEVNVYHDGEVTTPQTFNIILSGENEFTSGAFLGMGMSSGSAPGGVDIDFYAYSQGILSPTLATPSVDVEPDGDVDGFDFLAIQRTDISLIPLWESQFGTFPSPLAASVGTVPEPASALLAMTATLILFGKRSGRQSQLVG